MLLRGIAILLSMSLSIAYGQSNCPNISIYKTEKVSDTLEANSGLIMPLNFIIKEDSIIVSADALGKFKLIALRILSKKCNWNEDFSEGKSEFNLLLGADKDMLPKYPKLIIEKQKAGINYVMLLYEDSEKRFFFPLTE
jgi:hypothetical protein